MALRSRVWTSLSTLELVKMIDWPWREKASLRGYTVRHKVHHAEYVVSYVSNDSMRHVQSWRRHTRSSLGSAKSFLLYTINLCGVGRADWLSLTEAAWSMSSNAGLMLERGNLASRVSITRSVSRIRWCISFRALAICPMCHDGTESGKLNVLRMAI